jgi:hypothetical protein
MPFGYGNLCENLWGQKMRVLFDHDTLRQGKRGSVTGIVYFEFSPEVQFPEAGWNDFVIVVAN